MELNERISQVIKESGLNKTAFAKRINVTPAAVSQLCSGVNNPSAQTVADICEKFGISKEWLLNGTLPMKTSEYRDAQIAEMVNEMLIGSNEFKKSVIWALLKRSDTELETLRLILDDVYNSLK